MQRRSPRLVLCAFGLVLAVAAAYGSPQQSPVATTPSKAATPSGAADRPKQSRSTPQSQRPVSPSSIDVTVLDVAGRPIEGALVTALPAVGAYDGMQLRVEKLRFGITGKDGRTRLEKMPLGPWSVTAHARGFQAGRESRANGAALTLRLEKGGAITGVVLDGSTKAPVAGARVALQEGMPMPADWQERLARNEVVSDARGVFRLAGIGRGAVAIVARANGYGPATRNDARAGARLELFLFPGPTLSGTVRDEAGKPVAGASVRLFAQGWSQPPPVDATDAGGRFTAAAWPAKM